MDIDNLIDDLKEFGLVENNGDIRPLNKYRNFPDEKAKCIEKSVNHLDKLAGSKVWFASPFSFNDPFDCQNPAEYLTNDQDRNRKFIETLARKKGLNIEDVMKEFDTMDLSDETKIWEANCKMHSEVIYDAINIFSLSRNVKSILMWSHYADHHRGFVIGYNTKKLINSLGDIIQTSLIPKPVKYSLKMPPRVDTQDFDYFDSFVEKILLVKHEDWTYEEEYRFILFRQDAHGSGIEIDLPLSVSVVESITFGLKTNPDDEARLRKSISHWPEQPKLYRMKRKPYSFELDIVPA